MITINTQQSVMEKFIKDVVFSGTDRNLQEKGMAILIQNAVEKSYVEGRIGGFVVNEETRNDIRQALKQGQKITAIKIFRGATETHHTDGTISNISLIQAKEVIEQWAKDQGIEIVGNHV